MTINITRGIWGAIFLLLLGLTIIMSYRQGQVDAVRGKIFVEKKYMSANDSTDTRYSLRFWAAVWDKISPK
jgi:hypothetical protein